MLCFKTISNYKKLLLLLCLLLVTISTLAGTARRNEPIQPLRQEKNLDPRKVAIGDLLFHDIRLSADNTLSCASCHNLATNGSDSLPSSTGIGGAIGPIKSPTVYNSGTNFLLFWDGRAADLEEQAAGPINNPLEMGSNWEQVL
ncbi:MAG: cytochrome B6, partial [Gammaproteobacteria bacterium]|nr:cytochrome B6 [Gammaproteobacteria bacterium]